MKIFAKPLFAKNHDDHEPRVGKNKRREKETAALLNSIDYDSLPEATKAGTEMNLASEPETTRHQDIDNYASDSSADIEEKAVENFEILSHVSSVSTDSNYVTLFDALGNIVYTGSRATAIEEFAQLTPEELAGIYGSGDNALNVGLSAIEILISNDDSGIAQNLLQQNSSLYASYTAYINPQPPRESIDDALTMAF